ncbi:MAG: hypothetical protein WDO18_22665 [Acidobacteriota bacterium]
MQFTKLVKLSFAACALNATLSAQTMPSTPVIGLGNLAHTTETLDKTVPFYRDLIGLPINGNPLAGKPAAMDAENSRFTNTQGASFRAATFRIPNANFGFELTEFTGVSRKPGQPRCCRIQERRRSRWWSGISRSSS